MKQESNNEQQNTTAIEKCLSEREHQAMQMRYLGKTSKEIAVATGYNESHVRRLFMKGGRLEKAYENFVQKQHGLVQERAALALERARQEAEDAMERIVTLSKDLEGGPVCYKANEYLLTLAGVSRGATLRDILKSMNYETALEKLDELFREIYGKPIRTASHSIALIARHRYEKEQGRLASGEDLAIVLFGTEAR